MASFTLRTLAALAALPGLVIAAPTKNKNGNDWKNKIKNVIVLVEENRSFDTFCGALNYDRNNASQNVLVGY